MKKKFLVLFCFGLVFNIFSQSLAPLRAKDFEAQQIWVDSLLNSMSIDEKIGQLFMVQAYSNLNKDHEDFITEMITKYHIGNLIKPV